MRDAYKQRLPLLEAELHDLKGQLEANKAERSELHDSFKILQVCCLSQGGVICFVSKSNLGGLLPSIGLFTSFLSEFISFPCCLSIWEPSALNLLLNTNLDPRRTTRS